MKIAVLYFLSVLLLFGNKNIQKMIFFFFILMIFFNIDKVADTAVLSSMKLQNLVIQHGILNFKILIKKVLLE